MAFCLAVVAVTYTATFTQDINAQGANNNDPADCTITRGQDPFDVLHSGLRHNVWFVLDSSGSMDGKLPGTNLRKKNVARDIIRDLMTTLVDASGSPLVNWGYFPYSTSNPADKTCPSSLPPPASQDPNGDGFMDNPGGCDGLNTSNNVHPSTSACGENNLNDIFDAMDATNFTSGTPIGIGYDQISDIIEAGYFNNLGPGQKNFIIHLTDGQETCECQTFEYQNGGTSVNIRGSSTGWGVTTFNASDNASRRTFNAGLKAEESLRQIDPDLDGSKGNIFLVGMGLEPDRKERANHIAWLGSGARIAGRENRRPRSVTQVPRLLR